MLDRRAGTLQLQSGVPIGVLLLRVYGRIVPPARRNVPLPRLCDPASRRVSRWRHRSHVSNPICRRSDHLLPPTRRSLSPACIASTVSDTATLSSALPTAPSRFAVTEGVAGHHPSPASTHVRRPTHRPEHRESRTVPVRHRIRGHLRMHCRELHWIGKHELCKLVRLLVCGRSWRRCGKIHGRGSTLLCGVVHQRHRLGRSVTVHQGLAHAHWRNSRVRRGRLQRVELGQSCGGVHRLPSIPRSLPLPASASSDAPTASTPLPPASASRTASLSVFAST